MCQNLLLGFLPWLLPIIPFASVLHLGSQTAMLTGKVGLANSNQHLQRRRSISTLTTMTVTHITIRNMLKLLGEIVNPSESYSAFRYIKKWHISKQVLRFVLENPHLGMYNREDKEILASVSKTRLQQPCSSEWKTKQMEKGLDATAKPLLEPENAKNPEHPDKTLFLWTIWKDYQQVLWRAVINRTQSQPSMPSSIIFIYVLEY